MDNGVFWIVLNENGTYAGMPCYSWEEAKELLVQDPRRIAYIIDSVIDEVTNSEDGLL